jgi:transposase-like protein
MKEYKHLSIRERQRFYAFLDMGLSITEIARKISRNRSTLYREIKRNQDQGRYLPVVAHKKAQQRISYGRSSKIASHKALHEYILRGLKKGWSPEQISGRMKVKRLSYAAAISNSLAPLPLKTIGMGVTLNPLSFGNTFALKVVSQRTFFSCLSSRSILVFLFARSSGSLALLPNFA